MLTLLRAFLTLHALGTAPTAVPTPHACEIAFYTLAGTDLPDDAWSWAAESPTALFCR